MSGKLLRWRVWCCGLVAVVGLAIAFNLILARGTKRSITQQSLQRQQTLARAEASNIASFFQVFGESVAVFAQLSSMEDRNSKTLQDMNVLMEEWRDSNLVGGCGIDG